MKKQTLAVTKTGYSKIYVEKKYYYIYSNGRGKDSRRGIKMNGVLYLFK